MQSDNKWASRKVMRFETIRATKGGIRKVVGPLGLDYHCCKKKVRVVNIDFVEEMKRHYNMLVEDFNLNIEHHM